VLNKKQDKKRRIAMANIKKQLSLRQRKMWQALNPPLPKQETENQRLLRILRATTAQLNRNPIRGKL
jgi:hypothetical protein